MEKKVGVVGAGTMGASIAELLAINGIDVILKEVNDDLLKKGMERIRKIMESNVSYHSKRAKREIERIESLGITLSQEQKAVLKNNMKPLFDESALENAISKIHGTTSYSDFGDCTFVIEASFENADLKKEIFSSVSKYVSDNTVMSSNTSSISITSLSKSFRNPENTIVTHFFNPPYTLPLVEIVPSLFTSEKTLVRSMDFISSLKNHRSPMRPIKVKEVPGFLVNRMLVPLMNEAAIMLDEGVASAEDIDLSMKIGAGFPMGPLELADMVGNDIVLDVQEVLHKEYGDDKYRASLLLKRMVDAGRLGRKSGSGFYSYEKS
ncbi:MAG: 3-hydroxyacyl-CoA dehydrogenase family protein [Candidatus Thermoplasmatota archaeon]|nr:3-hydroxyacyl-CoA dehydrogenase family protein [Candidatus Thermoplasmatota archaeon]